MIFRQYPLIALSLLSSFSSAQYIIESSSFGHGSKISPNGFAVPGWHVSGEGQVPQIMSDKVILTPPYPGNRRGAIWADTPVSQDEWTANFEFRATGPERGSGNLQIWYTSQGQAYIGSNSIYTIGKFDGLVLVIDQHGGRGGAIRGFLNDGNVEFKTHHSVDSLAFGHCDYSYRNLGRPSSIQIKYDRDYFEVIMDGNQCFKSSNIMLPNNYYFGVSAASAETPDSFEVYKFLLQSTGSNTQQFSQPIVNVNDQQQEAEKSEDETPAESIKGQDQQFADLHNRLRSMSSSISALTREVALLSSKAERRHQELLGRMSQAEEFNSLDRKLQSIEQSIIDLKKDVGNKDYRSELSKIQDALKDTHANLLERLPSSLGEVVISSSPRMGLVLGILVCVQLALAASYVVYKRRRANAPKKYL
ncbi:MAG: hypothetical protein M1834_000774 [Cirrosporium novae-zelandiae]|nr:MAG: hypothetical protein M1834_000774 [Cirrosporium novae-zelandiae]